MFNHLPTFLGKERTAHQTQFQASFRSELQKSPGVCEAEVWRKLCREQLLSNPLDECLKAEGVEERGVGLKIFTPFVTTVGQPWD